MIGPFEIAAIAVIGSFVTKMFSIWAKKQRGEDRGKIQELERRIQELESHQSVKALEERVETLEGIVVSDEFDVKQKFQELEA